MINRPRPTYPTLAPGTPTIIPRAERQRYQPAHRGPGTILHRMIKNRTGEDYEAGCGCQSMVRLMNAWGPSGCREHIDEIINKILTEAKNRPKWKLLASLPGAKLVMKRMALSAIREAESVGQ